MFAHTEDNKVTFRGYLPKCWRNVSGLALSKDDGAFLKSIGWLPLTEVDIEIAADEIEDGEDILIEDDKVTITPKKRKMSSEEITARDERLMSGLRDCRNKLLEETDHYALADQTLTDEMKKYREDLRQLPQQTSDLTNINWPKEPS